MYFNFYYFFFFLRKYIKQKDMRLLLTFILFILGGFYTFGKENYKNEEFYLKKTKAANSKEIKKLVSTKWYDNKGKNASFSKYEMV